MDTLCDGLDGEIVETTVTGPVGSRVTSRYGYRQIRRDDYAQWNYIIGMDEENMRDLYRLFPQDTVHKLHLFLSFANEQRDVADSWFTGNFEQTYQDVVRGCAELLDRLIDKFA